MLIVDCCCLFSQRLGSRLYTSPSTTIQVLVYNGSGVSAASRDHALASLRSFLSHAYDVQLVSPKSLREDPWPASTALLVMPGGRDLPYQYDLSGKANSRIREYVEQGGKYLGLCAGAYYASGRVEFEVGTELEVVGDRELGFFPGTCRGTVFPGFAYETEAGARQATIELNRSAWRDHWSQSPAEVDVWYNGGGAFIVPPEGLPANVASLGSYSQAEGKPLAGVRCSVGGGTAVLWAVHPEHPTLVDSAHPPTTDDYSGKEHRRRALFRASLALLGLDASDAPAPPPKLSPLFLTSPDLSLVSEIAKAIASKCVPTPHSETSFTLKDRHDTFLLHPSSSAGQLLASAAAQYGSAEVDELHAASKHICACTEGVASTQLAPLFNLEAYFDMLQAATQEGSPSFGKMVLYGEAVTSTQTMLDKNDRFLSSLPTGLACLASHQIAGRGRGANSWVSPAGCLQFSLLLRLPQPQASKIVFIQYLFGLAVVEAVRTRKGYEDVGVRLKWPNDIYGEVAKGDYKKIGGILVNSSYAGNEFSLVVGCGVNTSNPKPTTSVNELVDLYNARTGSNLPRWTQEQLLAAVIAQFSSMWPVFLEQGFEPFVDSYLTRWIHSDQQVTIQASSQRVRIVGITPDHGLLRTVPIDVDRHGREVFSGGYGGAAKPFIDLQPDGNGFDMTQGLLVAR